MKRWRILSQKYRQKTLVEAQALLKVKQQYEKDTANTNQLQNYLQYEKKFSNIKMAQAGQLLDIQLFLQKLQNLLDIQTKNVKESHLSWEKQKKSWQYARTQEQQFLTIKKRKCR